MSQGLRLNIGCGSTVVAGWENLDRSPGPLLDRVRVVKMLLLRFGMIGEEHMVRWPAGVKRVDVRRGLPYDDASVDAVYSSHMLEHIYMDEARQLLAEIKRVLRAEGVVRLALPDAEGLALDLVNHSDDDAAAAALAFNRDLHAHPLERPRLGRRMIGRFGASTHLWQPTAGLVESMLRHSGFHDIERRQYRQGVLPDLEVVEHREESFFIEATMHQRVRSRTRT